jgi:iron complex transport system permease protein
VKKHLKFLLLALVVAALFLLALMCGASFFSPFEIFAAFSGSGDQVTGGIIMSLRLPRVILSLAVGASLALGGTVFQSILRNPLADPYIIGVSGGAALGAACAVVFNAQGPALALAAFAGSLLVVTLVEFLSYRCGYGSHSLILAGISLSFVLSSAVMLIFAMARSQDVHRALMWLMGDLSMARYDLLLPAAPAALAVFAGLMVHHRHCDIISFGEDFSRSMGVSPMAVRRLFWMASLLSAISVALAGVIGFVGLIVPHFFRYAFGPGHRSLMPLSALGGGVFLMLCDTVGRSLAPPFEIPAGVITGFAGGLFFLLYLVSHRSGDR